MGGLFSASDRSAIRNFDDLASLGDDFRETVFAAIVGLIFTDEPRIADQVADGRHIKIDIWRRRTAADYQQVRKRRAVRFGSMTV